MQVQVAKVRRTLAVGWFDNVSFVETCASRVGRIREVFFAWPGIKASRPEMPWTPARREQLLADLKWARANGLELDVVFNASCYGDKALTGALADEVSAALREMTALGVQPDTVTTASPFIATIVRQRFPGLKLRFSVNLDVTGTLALEYAEELFDSFYADRNFHRHLDYVQDLHAWALAHGKELGLFVNSGCLRHCPFHNFHNNLHGHDRDRLGQSALAGQFGFSVFRCRTNYERGRYEDFLHGLWLRPEELPLYEEHAEIIKLATRRHPDPGAVIRAYADYKYEGDLAKIVDPFFEFPFAVENARLGASPHWLAVRDCQNADNCRHCGKCAALLKEVAVARTKSDFSKTFTDFFRG